MDFLDPKKRQSHIRRLYLGYALVGIALFIATTILVFAASGFGVDRKTGEIIQNGLLFVDSHPQSTTVRINGHMRGETDSRYVLKEGTYDLELSRDGYRSWKQTFDIEGGGVERYVYPFLFPTTMTPSERLSYPSKPSEVTTSPDRRSVVAFVPSQIRTLFITDLSAKENNTKQVEIPSSVLADKPNQSLQLIEWSTDNRHILVKHVYDGGFEYLVIDKDSPELSINVSTSLGQVYSDVRLRDKKPNQLYVLDTNKTLYTASLGSTDKALVATQVEAYRTYADDEVLYVSAVGAPEGKVRVYLKRQALNYVLRDLAISDRYVLNMASFDGSFYVVIGASSEDRAYIYKNPYKDAATNPTKQPMAIRVLKIANVQFASFSANARFIAVQSGKEFTVFDAERVRQYHYDAAFDIAPTTEATWMDGHRLTVVDQGQLRAFDFNGTNTQTLVPHDAAYDSLFDRDYNMLYSVTVKSDGTFALSKTLINLGEADQF